MQYAEIVTPFCNTLLKFNANYNDTDQIALKFSQPYIHIF